ACSPKLWPSGPVPSRLWQRVVLWWWARLPRQRLCGWDTAKRQLARVIQTPNQPLRLTRPASRLSETCSSLMRAGQVSFVVRPPEKARGEGCEVLAPFEIAVEAAANALGKSAVLGRLGFAVCDRELSVSRPHMPDRCRFVLRPSQDRQLFIDFC